MRKGSYALPAAVLAGLLPLAASAADVCNRITGKGLFDGVCQECFNEGRCQIADFFIVGNTVVKLILGLSGSVMLLMVIYGGFLWLASGGNSNLVDKGKKVLIGAIIGLIIVFGAYTSMQFLVAALVCQGNSSCPVVNEIFSRPFQAVKPPGAAPTTTPPASGGSTAPTGNPTAGTPASGSGPSCICSVTYSYDSKQVTGTVFQQACSNGNKNGITCTMSGNDCVCNGPSSASQSSCTTDDNVKAFAIPVVGGITTQGGCNWSASQ